MSDCAYLAHYGVKGQKHGVRQYQNPDGSLTALGRIHYGVGAARGKASSAVKSVGKAIRKKVKPTEADLDEEIAKQRAKNASRDKKQQLKDLKRGIDEGASKGVANEPLRGQNKRFSELSDAEIADRIRRLENEIKLADLERTKNLGPGMRMVDRALREGGQQAIKNIVSNTITKAGEKALSSMLFGDEEKDQKAADHDKKELEARKAKKELEQFKKDNPEGLAKYTPSARKAAQKKRAEEKVKDFDETLKRESDRSAKRASIAKERSKRANAYQDAGLTREQIAKKMGISVGSVDYYLNYKTG